MGVSRQEYWSGLPFPSAGDLPNPGIEPASLMSPALAGRFFATSATKNIYNNAYCFCCSVAQLCPTLCNPMDYSTQGFPVFTVSQNLLKVMSCESVMTSNYLLLCRPLLLLPSIFPSIRVFSRNCLFESGGKGLIGVSVSVLPMNTQD